MFSLRSLPTRLKHAPLRVGFAHIRSYHFKNMRWDKGQANRERLPNGTSLENSGLGEWLEIIPKAQANGVRADRQTGNNITTILESEHWVLPKLALRDMCTCPRCVDQSTRQKLFSTVEIPSTIGIQDVIELPDSLEIEWKHDLPGFEGHKSVFSKKLINALASTGSSKTLPSLPSRRLWSDAEFRAEAPDMTYEAYMHDDATLYQALQQLHSHGLLFLKDVPESAESVARITQRIGPLKNTFYGETWDVRSVPKAKNVAYTSQDLGFHMDLMYMKQPPHLQFLHCIRSSAKGGASLFTDSFKAVKQLFEEDEGDFSMLQHRPMTFHYDHIDSHYYQQSRPAIELAPLTFGPHTFADFHGLRRSVKQNPYNAWIRDAFKLEDFLEAVSWAPPFQAPFQLTNAYTDIPDKNFGSTLEVVLRRWNDAARKFNALIHQEENIHERMMKPGECVIFDNRRVLHARKAFEVADAGKERWLRGAYLDKDPFMSKLRVLANRSQSSNGASLNEDMELRAEAAAAAA